MQKRFIFRWWYLLILVPLLLLAGFLIWALTPLGPMPEAVQALESSETVLVETDPWYIFTPIDQVPAGGLILYPGGRVDPRSYAPAAHAIASQGYHVVIVPMPLNLAVLGAGRAADVIASYPEIQDWVIGGHSLGGSMAANFTKGSPELIDGLVFWASYPASSDDLSTSAVLVSSISASLDGLTTPDDIEASRALLPQSTTWVVIDGGNHAQFGWYGEQNRDDPAVISREQQQEQVVKATLELLRLIQQDNN